MRKRPRGKPADAEQWALRGRIAAGSTALGAAVWVIWLAAMGGTSGARIDLMATADVVFFFAFIRATGAFLKAGRRRLTAVLLFTLLALPLFARGQSTFYAGAEVSYVLVGPAFTLYLGVIVQDLLTAAGQRGELWTYWAR